MADLTLSTIDIRKKRWCDLLFMKEQPKVVFTIKYTPDALDRPWPWPDKKQERIEWAWETYVRHMKRIEWLEDDSIPFLDLYSGTDIFAEAFGCKIYRPDNDMPFARPLIHDASEVSRLKVPEVSTSSLATLFEIADELRKRAGSDALVRLPDIQSPMDIAALIWDKNEFYPALIYTPEAVRELASKVNELLTAFLDEWFTRYGQEFMAHCPDYYMPKGITLSEDEAGVVNENMFDELFLPELVDLSDRYGGIGMHCCANARHQWNNFLKIPNLRLLNLVQPEDVLQEAYKFFASHVAQMHSWCGDGPAWTWPKQYPENARVALQTVASSREEAIELSERLSEALSALNR